MQFYLNFVLNTNIIYLCSVRDADSKEFHVFARILPTDMKHRQQHLEACELLSAVCAEVYGIRNLRIRRDEHGKPKLIHPFLHMNLAHCKGLAVCAVGNVSLGVDAEPPRTAKPSIISRICAENEMSQLAASDNPDALFSRFWTLKEAYGKWDGGGIRLPLETLGFSLGNDKIVFHHSDADKVSIFQILLDFHDMSQYAVSICTNQIGTPKITSNYNVLTSFLNPVSD